MKKEKRKKEKGTDGGIVNYFQFPISNFPLNKGKGSRAFTFIELLVAIAVFAIIAIGIMKAFAKTTSALTAARAKVVGTFLAGELMEQVRNLPYSDVGVEGSIPSGRLARTQKISRDEIPFTITTTVRNVDDPFDGTLGNLTKPDLAPADYKLVEIKTICDTCQNFRPIVLTTIVAPKAMEAPDQGGGILVKSFDANGQAVSNAAVHVAAIVGTSTITIDDATNLQGELTLIGLPAAMQSYGLMVTKQGYTTDRTYPVGGTGNPNPIKPDVTVATGTVTSLGFSIDRPSTLTVKMRTASCAPLSGVAFRLVGSKKIGTNPDVYKLNQGYTTDEAGNKTLNNIEWDEFTATLTDALYDLGGTIPFSPFSLLPATVQDFVFILKPKSPSALLITVKDAATKLPITGAVVAITKDTISHTQTTGRGAKAQSDWSGAAGQATSTSETETRYFSQDGNVETNAPAGNLHLRFAGGEYATGGVITSSSFDTGTASAFYNLMWSPSGQPPLSGTSSVRFQIATNSDGGEWNFYGPDGTPQSFYTSPGQTIAAIHNGDRYLRYRAYLSSASTTTTPTVSDISFVYSTGCTPAGQVFWNGLPGGTWNVAVSHPNYNAFGSEDISLGSNWQEYVAEMTHN